ncbi:hypothetical protein ABNB59_15385 [Paenibacillus larvae]|uniref:Phage protein n=7 Tax=root TaxID=1 RepID=A0A0K2CYZ7_9CAUD|nr:hypothetical protein [Paenibacillus larvae]YP_009196165.1 hypothetical protein VEGAS_66 [Paenibacillus phage Vegas]ALA12794.1 hypothetical protein HAYLEY_64 [Paenibacillus phage Hayley]ALA12881.1 hypothetical protein VADIM_66 [Paenibacillus phage Vadim]ALA12967.1 hypothetical protein DIANE_66 [Paenibacillus phage Diane]ALA12711.1 hypothetical protein VEGAS_66 [Paenibacillus phage Vegas]AQR76360.1 hypothetical protein BXP28_02145 [Paenibacillus larvae subsp. larvae]
MFNRDALEYLSEQGQPEIIEVNGQQYATHQLYEVVEPTPEPLVVRNLSGLIDYLKSEFDKQAPLLVHVVSPTQVTVVSSYNNDYARKEIIKAEALLPEYRFGSYYEAEDFIIKLQSGFVANEDRAKLLKVVGNVKEENVRSIGDDGVSQSVTAKTGVATVEDVKVPNPVLLAPYRTFVEVIQPESAFVFRMKNGPLAALFEADGGAWRNAAIDAVATYLVEKLSELIETGQIVVIA